MSEHLNALDDILEKIENTLAHITLDQDGKIVSWSGIAVAMFGYTAEEAVGAFLADLVIPATLRPAHTAGLERWRKSGPAAIVWQRLRSQAMHKDGSMIPVVVSVQVVNDEKGTRFLGWVMRDE